MSSRQRRRTANSSNYMLQKQRTKLAQYFYFIKYFCKNFSIFRNFFYSFTTACNSCKRFVVLSIHTYVCLSVCLFAPLVHGVRSPYRLSLFVRSYVRCLLGTHPSRGYNTSKKMTLFPAVNIPST